MLVCSIYDTCGGVEILSIKLSHFLSLQDALMYDIDSKQLTLCRDDNQDTRERFY